MSVFLGFDDTATNCNPDARISYESCFQYAPGAQVETVFQILMCCKPGSYSRLHCGLSTITEIITHNPLLIWVKTGFPLGYWWYGDIPTVIRSAPKSSIFLMVCIG